MLGIEESSGLSLAGDWYVCHMVLKPLFVLPATLSGWVDGHWVGRGKSWQLKLSQISTYPPEWAGESLNKISTGFAFLFLNVTFVFRHVTLWVCITPFPSFWCIPMRLKTEMHCGVIIGLLVKKKLVQRSHCLFTIVSNQFREKTFWHPEG